jgi:hypothetical protein
MKLLGIFSSDLMFDIRMSLDLEEELMAAFFCSCHQIN